MIKIFVDSGSSIKQEEKEFFNVEILPLKILLEDKEYLDGVDLSMEVFYDALINKKAFPKTSLPSLEDAHQRITACTSAGYDVIIITISSGISGTHNALKNLFANDSKVRVIDSQNAVGGIKILALEANKYLDKSLDEVEEKLNALIPRIRALAVPETLDYLKRGGRLSTASYAVGKLLKINPVIELKNTVNVAGKVIGIKRAMQFILNELENCDVNYPLVPSYTYKNNNLEELVAKANAKFNNLNMLPQDDLDPAIACHWGPNAFGFVYVEKTRVK